MKNNEKIAIGFGGFYESIHMHNVDRLIDSYNSDGEYPEYNFDNVNFRKTYLNYINSYCSHLSDYIKSEYNVDMDFKNLELQSPEYYNYSTDKILADIPANQIKELNSLMIKDALFLEFLKERTKSYDGYFSFYTYETALSNKDNVLVKYVLEYICNKFNENFYFGDLEYEIELKKVA